MIYSAKNKVRIIPWDQSSAVDVDEMYTQLTWLKDHRKPSGVTQNKLGSYTEIFNGGKRLLVYGRPGMHSNFFYFKQCMRRNLKSTKWGTQQMFKWGGSAQGPNHYHFSQKRYPFHVPCLWLCIPFNCCECTVFSVGINHKNRTFSQLNKP